MTNELMNSTANDLALIAFSNYYFDDFKSRADIDAYIDDFESLTDALAADIDDLLKNRNESDLFPDADDFDDADAELFFDRIYRTDLFDAMIAELARIITARFPK